MTLNIQFLPFPVIETERLILRNLDEGDIDDVFAIRGHKETMQYIPRPIAQTREDAKNVLDTILGFTERNEKINWAITEKGVNRLIGIIGYVNIKHDSLRAEVGYVLHHGFLRRGYTLEALKAVLDYGFTVMNLHSIEAIIRTENHPSARLVEKAGFVKEACFREYIFHNEKFWDAYVYSLLRNTDNQNT